MLLIQPQKTKQPTVINYHKSPRKTIYIQSNPSAFCIASTFSMANNNNRLLILTFIFFAFATIIIAQSPAPSPAAEESTADEPTNSALSPFAVVPPSGDLISDIAPSSDDGPAAGDADAASVGAPNANYPPSDDPIATDHYKEYSGSGSIKVATTAIASIFLFTGCLLF